MSSAKTVWPVTLPRASTRRLDLPMTRSSSLFGTESPAAAFDGFDLSDKLAPQIPGASICGLVPIRNFDNRSFDGVENLKVTGAAAEIS